MRNYALTYPQLMNQAIAAGYEPDALIDLRVAYALSEGMCDGLHRPQGTPFLCHLVRTASIVLGTGAPAPVVRAALVHAAYRLEHFSGSRRRPAGNRRRARLRRTLGSEVEQLVWEYEQQPWYRADALERHLAQLDTYAEPTRQALLIRCGDELDDALDMSPAYTREGDSAARRADFGDGCVELARRLGAAELAAELARAYEQCRGTERADALRTGRSTSYERSRFHLWERTLPERLFASALAAARRVLRRASVCNGG